MNECGRWLNWHQVRWNSNLDTFWVLIELHHATWEGSVHNPEPPRALVLGLKFYVYVSRPMGGSNAGRLQRPTQAQFAQPMLNIDC